MQGEDSLKEQDLSRRKLLQVMGAATFCASFPANVVPESVSRDRDASEKSRIPKIALELSRTGSYFATGTVDEAGMRRLKQLGVSDVLMGGPPIPWLEPDLRALIDKLKAGGLELGNMMITGFPNTVYGKPGRDEEIEKIQQSVRAAGRVGLPVVEYNFYAHRLVEGYYGETGRGGAGLTAFDYDRVKDLPPLAEEGAHKLEEMWSNITYFLRAVIPIAEESGVRLALHPNDPPAPLSRGSQQIMGSVEGWKRLISIVPSKSNGITFDCGVTREMGQDPVEVCRYFGRDRKSTRLNSSHSQISYAVFCLKKKKTYIPDADVRLIHQDHDDDLDVHCSPTYRNRLTLVVEYRASNRQPCTSRMT